ncbi:MAG: DMT family transporter [Chitinophagaceae bacterium]|nr:DMT family transporter [Chitinophagaceae bacterium]
MKKAFIQLHIAVFLAGFTAILGKLIILNEGLLVWYRMLITTITLLLILIFTREFIKLSFKNTFRLFGVGVIVALHWLTFYGSIKYSNASVGLTCLSAIGFFTAFIDPMITRRRIDWFEVILGLMAIAGIYLIFNFYPEYKKGIIFGIISALLASIFPILNKKLLTRFTPKIVTVYEMCGGFLALTFIIPFYFKLFPAKYFFPTTTDWLWLLVLAWLCTVLSFILQLNALKKISPFTANLTYNLEPIYGIIFAFIIFHENKYLSSGFYVGLSLILLAVVLQMARVFWVVRRERLRG